MPDVNAYELINIINAHHTYYLISPEVWEAKMTTRATTRHTTADQEEWPHRTSNNHTTESEK